MPTALITGASAGLGAAFARRLAGDGFTLVINGRDAGRLRSAAQELHRRYGATVETLPADLAAEEGIAAVEERLRAGVDLLVNNAGFGHRDVYLKVPVEDERRMLTLHCEAVLRLTSAALPGMAARRRGGVINVGSVAAFLPSDTTYGPSKAWVVAFSQTAAGQVAGTGVRVMALCPGFTHTEFHQRSGQDISGIPEFMWLDADRVVATAMRDFARGLRVSVPDPRYKAIVALARLIPPNLAGRLAELFADRLR
ncbi:SDR family oxidoreductase [Thermopolyspora sp. NPDC052614]|uniref:SDR family NAD(P)-dependent oxidoreductase n=1 Tax=Thermopolyspora sp. NPDC052614 TaxID=3155682 RepID=UPI0034345B87